MNIEKQNSTEKTKSNRPVENKGKSNIEKAYDA